MEKSTCIANATSAKTSTEGDAVMVYEPVCKTISEFKEKMGA